MGLAWYGCCAADGRIPSASSARDVNIRAGRWRGEEAVVCRLGGNESVNIY